MQDTERVEPTAQSHPLPAAPSQPPVGPETKTNLPLTTFQPSATIESRTAVPGFTPHPAQTDFEIQLALARRGFSPGPIDGVMGPQTRAALKAFQQRMRLSETGMLDEVTKSHLMLEARPLQYYMVQNSDVARLLPLSTTWVGKSQQDRLDYENILELAAEIGQASPNQIRKLNPSIDWNNIHAGARIVVPSITIPTPAEKASFARIYLASRILRAYDLKTNVIAHFPCSIAASVDKRPVGELHVRVVIKDPDYTFNPEVFPESPEARPINRKLVIPPGPNNPVGVAWIGLDRPGYGIHGTPVPESVGRTESHGCFRLANWNAEHLRRLAWVGMPVFVEP